MEVIFLYEIDPPLCFQDSRGHIVGVVPEIFSTAAKSLNLTIKYKPADPPNIWGSKLVEKKSESLQIEGRHFRSKICNLSDV